MAEMSAIEYFNIKNRMTNNCTIHCNKCELSIVKNETNVSCISLELEHPQKAIDILAKWAEENPIKTEQIVFLEKYPNTKLGENGFIAIQPCDIGFTSQDSSECRLTSCDECCRKYWGREVE